MRSTLRTVLFSTLFPSSARPTFGVPVETRLRELLASGELEAKVVAPVPWFFSRDPRFGTWAQWARTPRLERRNGIEVLHPRYLLPPKIGMNIAPFTLALGALPALRRLIDDGFDFDLIDAHYYYPDGPAAALLARHFNKPFSITARGSDLNLISRYFVPRHLMQWAARHANASIGVSGALIDILKGWGVDPGRLHVMRNGVDLERFKPEPPDAARARLGLDGSPLLLCVGNLVELKGHHLVIDALAQLVPRHREARLVIVGEGPRRAALERQVASLGLASRVTFAGSVAHEHLSTWYSAADVLVLPSSREGWPNVLLESMACGTPVIASAVGATREIVREAVAGRLLERRDPASIAEATEQLFVAPPQRTGVRRYAERFGWDATTRAQLALFERIVVAGDAPVGYEGA